MPETLYIIDAHSQIFRAYYAPFRPLTSPTGEPTRATYVFCTMLLKLLKEKQPTYLVMAADGPSEKLHRKKIFPDYKVTRKPAPADLPPQIRRIFQIVGAMGIPILQIEGYEADDIIATLADQFAAPGREVVLVSGDKDLDQLITEQVVLYDPMKNRVTGAAELVAEKGYAPEKAVEVQTLCGDTIDNVPGIEGVGPKTAAKLIAQYGSVQGVVDHADELTPKLQERIREGANVLATSRKLVTLDRHVPIDLKLVTMAFTGLRGEVRPIFAELGFARLLEQLDQLGVAGETKVETQQLAAAAGQTTAADCDYQLVNTSEGLDKLVKELAAVKRLGVDTETTGLPPLEHKLVGLSLAWKPQHGVYIPVKGPLGAEVLSLEEVREKLGPILEDPAIEKVGQNIKFDMNSLSTAGMALRGRIFDTMIAAHVLDSTRMTYKLDALAAEFLIHRCIPIEDLIGRGKKQITMDLVPLETIATYAAEDADTALRLAEMQAKKLQAEGLMDLFADLEMPLLPVLADMEQRGVRVDPRQLKRMEAELSKQADALRQKIIDCAGVTFNPDSPKQLADVLFKTLNLPPQRLTKTGASTDSDVLEELASQHELPALVLDYRKLTKLLGTYLKGLYDCIHPVTGRIHTTFHQTGTATGRLSSSDPNLQNIPIRSDEGRQIRSAFVADEGFVLLSADYSQVELRVLAHFCRDPILLRAFEEDQDIHRIVAAEVFHVPVAEVTPAQRARAKTVNFGIIYGQTAFGLAASLRIGRKEASDFIAAYRARFPRIQEFLQECIDAAKRDGYVQTIFKRRRTIPEIGDRNPSRRAAAERLAINSVVQGSAADLIKQAMLNIDRRIRGDKHTARMLLQIHDELLFEIPEADLARETNMIVREMSAAIELRVPLKVDVGSGRNWMDAK